MGGLAPTRIPNASRYCTSIYLTTLLEEGAIKMNTTHLRLVRPTLRVVCIAQIEWRWFPERYREVGEE